MKIIDAVWEKRNLGVDTMEFVVENDDDEAVMPKILKAEKQYNVVKLPVNRPELTSLFQENGYRFAECMLNVTHDLNLETIKAAKLLGNPETICMPMDKTDISELFYEIKKGLFDSDRIYNDPVFSKEAAAERYINWISDECQNGSAVYKIALRGGTVGFFAVKAQGADVYNPFLLGLYNSFKGLGLGVSLGISILTQCLKCGAKQVSNRVSSNNPAAIKTNELLGYKIRAMEYVFIKHRREV